MQQKEILEKLKKLGIKTVKNSDNYTTFVIHYKNLKGLLHEYEHIEAEIRNPEHKMVDFIKKHWYILAVIAIMISFALFAVVYWIFKFYSNFV